MNAYSSFAVIGASGKMGRGIALLILYANVLRGTHVPFHLNLIDINRETFSGLKAYLHSHLLKFAERNIAKVRQLFKDNPEIVSNSEAIDAFLHHVMGCINCSTHIGHVEGADLVFEAAFEEVSVKVDLLKKASQLTKGWFFTNTSSIPIHLLAEESGLKERLVGLHFYNPPPVQKLLEIIPSRYTDPRLLDLSMTLSKEMNKIPIQSQDVAGFIGNGHFSREILYAFQAKDLSIEEVDFVTREFLLRPMGIFQLLDYVGWDVASNLLKIMSRYLPDPSFQSSHLEQYFVQGIRGGQTADGEQKEGIFKYEGHKPVAVYDLATKTYRPLKIRSMGEVPLGLSWKKALKDKMDLKPFFEVLKTENSEGSRYAMQFLKHSKNIEDLLVSTGVSKSLKDVGVVLKEGFHHLYAPHEVLE